MSVVTFLLCTSGGLGTVAVPASAHPDPEVSSDRNGLSEAEIQTLWSGDHDHGPETTASEVGDRTSAIQALASQTDFSDTTPPATAATWTQNDFRELAAGDADTSVAPVHADRTSGDYLHDAHATIFAVQPSTWTHLSSDRTPLYLAPDGRVQALVDYRVRVPADDTRGNTTIDWRLTNHDVTRVELRIDDRTVARTSGDQTPVLTYDRSDYQSVEVGQPTTLTLAATVSATLKRTKTVEYRLNRTGSAPVTTTTVETSTRTETRTLSQTIPVIIYDLSARALMATYPNGDRGILIANQLPWHGLTLGEGPEQLRGHWRFYTARDQRWDTLVVASTDETVRRHSPAHPVYVHAFPSRIGLETRPIRDGPTIQRAWGTQRDAPVFPSTIQIGEAERSYEQIEGVVVRTATPLQERVLVRGLVRGVTQRIQSSAIPHRSIRSSSLTLTVLRANRTGALLRVTLRDSTTGAPIALNTQRRKGVITIDGKRLETNASGIATVWVTRPGSYQAVFDAGDWEDHEPAYTNARASARWHPLLDSDGWLDVLTAVVSVGILALVLLYGASQLGRLFSTHPERFDR